MSTTALPHIQIYPHSDLFLDDLHEKIVALCKDEWKIVSFKDPEDCYHPINTFIAFSKKPYSNLGYLRIKLLKEHISVYFLQPPLGIKSSPKIISFLFNRFISLIKYKLRKDIKAIFILDFEQQFCYNYTCKYPYLDLRVKVLYSPKEILWNILPSIKSLFADCNFSKNIEFYLRPSSESIELILTSKGRLFPYLKKDIANLQILLLFHLYDKIDFIEEIRVFNPLMSK